MSGIGFLLAAGSAVFNGSFVAFSKMPSVMAAKVDPLVFQLYTSLGVFLSSLLTIPFLTNSADAYPPSAIGWGLLGGGLFVCAVAFSFVTVQLVGLSIGQGVWSGSAVLVSFIWGVAAFGDQVEAPMAGVGLALIVVGVAIIAGCGDIAEYFAARTRSSSDATLHKEGAPSGSSDASTVTKTISDSSTLKRPLMESTTIDVSSTLPMVSSPSQRAPSAISSSSSGNYQGDVIVGVSGSFVNESTSSSHQPIRENSVSSRFGPDHPPSSFEFDAASASASAVALHRQRQLYGIVCALITGVFGGSILMPLQLAPKAYQGLTFVPSFGLGALVVSPLITLPYMFLSRNSNSRGAWAPRAALLPGLLAGAVWNAANVCSIYAISRIGYAVAYPLMQCAIVVAACWGVLVFKEIRGKQIGVMAGGATVVLSGALLLALSKN